MTKAKKTTTKAKAEASAARATTKAIEDSMNQAGDFAGMFSGYAEDGLKKSAELAQASSDVMRQISSRNMDFFAKTLEQGMEATQSLSGAKDPREFMEIQTGFAKDLFSSYTNEMSAQAELCMSAWRDAAKPFMAFASK